MKKVKSILSISFVAMLIVSCIFITGCGEKATSSTTNDSTESDTSVTEQATEVNVDLPDKVKAVIEVKDQGKIELELDTKAAPITVSNFVKLAKEGFYDGITFHRIIDGFMIQGGDPTGTGTGGSDNTIKGEFSDNGVDNDISHVRGVISMARSQLPDSASSQFFIVHKDSTFLDGQYAAFGKVTSGMEVVDALAGATYKTADENGVIQDKTEQPVIKSVKIVE